MNLDLFNYKVIDGREEYTPDLGSVCRLRYQVYVNEWGFEKAEDHPGGIEHDEYDQHSIHLYACSKHSEDIVGAARLILGSERSLPIENHFCINQLPTGVRREQTAEISRLAISKEFRCRVLERLFSSAGQGDDKQIHVLKKNIRDLRRRCEHQLVRGLYISLYRECKIRGLTHLFTIMSKGLHMILKRWGIIFEQIGPARDYHGIRAPYLLSINDIEHSLQRNNPSLFLEVQQVLTH
jgi:N-acyl amino acid synthase of PEP-CTERM/exosortase system